MEYSSAILETPNHVSLGEGNMKWAIYEWTRINQQVGLNINGPTPQVHNCISKEQTTATLNSNP